MNDSVKKEAERLGLNDHQIKFCEHYLVTQHQQKSAISAGYSEKTASAQASRLMTNPKIKEFLNVLKEDAMNSMSLDSTQVVKWVYDLASDAGGAKESTRLKALELLMKYHGLLIDKKEVTQETNVTLSDQAKGMSDDELEALMKQYETIEPVQLKLVE